MHSKERRDICIGIVLENINTDFSKELVTSIVNSVPAGRNIRTVILPGKYDDGVTGQKHEYRSVVNSVFRLAELCTFDGMIFHLGSITPEQENEFRRRFPERFGDMPAVFIGLDTPGLVTVNYDNENGIKESISYLISILGVSEICMLGGREDNKDARQRKDIFIRCLEEAGAPFRPESFVNTDMSPFCTAAAEKLLNDNPNAQAVFCVNDATACALYKVMEQKGLVPGRDIMVFGFDNTNVAGELMPSLSSIGSYETSIGQTALELVLSMINGEHAEPALVPTRLYGRESLPYTMYDYTELEMINIDPAFISRMFDDCFYKYKLTHHDRRNIDLRRLFCEFIRGILTALKCRYMSIENYNLLCRMIDIFFANGGMKFTDASKLLNSVAALQHDLNSLQQSAAAGLKINRLFLRIKDKALLALSKELSQKTKSSNDWIRSLQYFSAGGMGFVSETNQSYESIIKNINLLGSDNAAFYMYEKPFVYTPFRDGAEIFPEYVQLVCIIRDGVVKRPLPQRMRCRLRNIFVNSELPRGKGFAVFPVFHRNIMLGLLLCEPDETIYDRGEFMALELGKAVYMNRLSEKKRQKR